MQFIFCREDCIQLSHAPVMSGNRESCGSQLADMQYHHRVSSQGSHGKSSNHSRAPRITAVEERGNSRHGSRVSNSSFRSGNRSVARSKPPSAVAKMESSSLSNSSLAQKPRQISASPDRRNLMCCLSGSSDESGSDLDIEVGTSAKRGISEVPVIADTATAGRGGSGSLGTSGFTVFANEVKDRDAGALSRPLRIQPAGTLNWDEHPVSLSSDGRRAHAATSTAFSYDQDGLRETRGVGMTSKASRNSLVAGPVTDCQYSDDSEASAYADKRGRLGAERVCNCDVEISADGHGHGHALQGRASMANSSRRFGQFISSTRGSECKRKSGAQGILSRRSRGLASQGAGLGESNVVASAHSTGLNRRNLTNLGCSSAADVLPSVSSSSSSDGAPDRLRNRKLVGAHGVNNGTEALRGIRPGKSSVASSSIGCMPHRTSRDGSGGLPPEQNFPKVPSLPVRPVRRSPPGFQPDTRCSRRPTAMESDSMVSSGSLAYTGGQSPVSSRGRRGGSPSVSRGRNAMGSLVRSNEHFLDTNAAYGEEVSHRYAGNSSRFSSAGSSFANQLGAMGVENGSTNRTRPDFGSPSSMASFVPEEQTVRSSSNFSGPPPTRPPPLPPTFGSVLHQSSAVQIALSPPSFTTSPPRLPRFVGLASSPDDHERHNLLAAEPRTYGPFHGFQLHSAGESRPRLTVEGLSEILSALEHVERDEDLSYEQILMLEATILLGGIGLHDRHREMRLDVDNMSYEELLALEERIGNVSTGLNEEAIAKCLKRSRYSSLDTAINYVPQDIEIKCSICQEEFEETVELGILDCGHSHHIACIKQWLLQKNQCPICKSSAFS